MNNNKKRKNFPPQYIMDLMIGYSKQNSKFTIPTYLNALFGIYYFIFKQKDLFRMKFKECISSISSGIALSNECDKLSFKIGNFVIQMKILESEININEQGKVNYVLKKINGKKWKINKNSKYIDVVIRICPRSIEFFFYNLQEIWNFMEWKDSDVDIDKILSYHYQHYHMDRKMKTTQNHGYCKILLNDHVDYDNQQVSIEAHGTDKMNIWSSKQIVKDGECDF